MLRDLYYLAKPTIPKWIRWEFRRSLAKCILRNKSANWPINSGSEIPPSGWKGWPDNKRFTFVLTHDVEGTRGLDQVKQLAELERDYHLRSSFNFIPEGPYRLPGSLRRWLTTHGFEVGVHDLHHDGHLYRSRQGFSRKARRINHYLKQWDAVGFRSAFMLNRLEWLHELNIEYDASSFDTDPFEPQPQGRNTIFPFQVRNENGPGYIELPYTLPQDSTLFLLLEEKGIDLWKKKLDWIASHGGMALVNIHPDYVNFDERNKVPFSYPSRFIEEFFAYVKERFAGEFWNPVPAELASWIRHS